MICRAEQTSSANPGTSTTGSVDKIQASVADHTKQASRHRLNQPPRAQNQNLAKVNIAQQRNNLQKQKTRADTLVVDVEVWIYLTGGKAPRKVPAPSIVSHPKINVRIRHSSLRGIRTFP